MPWNGPEFVQRHAHALSPSQGGKAASIANAILRRSPGSEGMAIATGIARAKAMGRAAGGGIPHLAYGGDAGGGEMAPVTPSVATVNPVTSSLYSQYQGMTPEQLQEFVLRAGGSKQGQVAKRILDQKRMMPSGEPVQQDQSQAAPAPLPGTTPSPPGYAIGGSMSMSQADPWWTRREASEAETGFLHSSVPGRTDHIPASPAADSYVIPADVVSGLGEGNSLAGAHILDLAFNHGPHGIPMPRSGGHGGMGIPHPAAPRLAEESRGGARTGMGRVPIMAAGGEYIVHPQTVRLLGRGDARRGHQLLDKYVVSQRNRIIKTMRKLPGPVRN